MSGRKSRSFWNAFVAYKVAIWRDERYQVQRLKRCSNGSLSKYEIRVAIFASVEVTRGCAECRYHATYDSKTAT